MVWIKSIAEPSINIKAGRIVSVGLRLHNEPKNVSIDRIGFKVQTQRSRQRNQTRTFVHQRRDFRVLCQSVSCSSTVRDSAAARHYFNKSASELSRLKVLLRACCKVGIHLSVEHTEDEPYRKVVNAIRCAHERVQYVLGRMHAEGHVSTALYNSVKDQEIPFQRGMFQFSSTRLLMRYEKQVPLSDIHEYNIDNPSATGLRIVTTVDQDIHRHAQYGWFIIC